MRYVVAYDISDDKRRKKVHETLKSYGAWKEYSVFEVRLDDTTMLNLENKIKDIIEDDEDKVRIYPLCERCEKKIDDWGKDIPDVKKKVV